MAYTIEHICVGAGVGVILGAFVGFLLRPAIPLIGQQLPFEAVISRGASLKGLDQLLVGIAQQSFNYLVIGALVCGTAGALFGYLAKGKAVDSPRQPNTPRPATVQLGDSRETVVAVMGAPQKVIDLGPKTLYVYPDLKITFVDGKVSDVQ